MRSNAFKLPIEDNLNMQVYAWLPEHDQDIKAVVQIAHGMAEHGKRYADFAKFLNTHGYAVYANDHRGHGQTAGSLDNVGYFSDKDGFNKAVNDLKKLSEDIKSKHPDKPLFLLGHSMGTFLFRKYMMDPPVELKGVILSGTAGHPGLLGQSGIFISNLLKIFNSPKAPSPLMNALSFKAYNKAFKPNRTDFDWLSRDHEKVDEYVNDPYCGTVFSIQFFNDLINGLLDVSDQKNIDKTNENLPLLLVSGAEDPVGNNGKGVTEVFNKFNKTGLKDLTLKLFENGRHEILNETNRVEVYNFILNWLEERI